MKKVICLIIILASLFLVSCGEAPITPTGTAGETSANTPIEEPKHTIVPVTHSLYHAAIEAPSRVLLAQGGGLWYYSKVDGESYRFCFNPLCQHTFAEKCPSQFFWHAGATRNEITFSESENRFYFLRGQNVYSTSFDASDLKLVCSLGSDGGPDQPAYNQRVFALTNISYYDGYVYFCYTNDMSGRNQIIRCLIKTGKVEQMTPDDEWVIAYEIADGYIYFKTIDEDNVVTYYTTDMDFKERRIVSDPIDPTPGGLHMGIYDGKYFYKKYGDELYALNPRTDEKKLIAKDEEYIKGAQIVCVYQGEVYFILHNPVVIGTHYVEPYGEMSVSTTQNNVWKVTTDGEIIRVLDFPRGNIRSVNFIEDGVIVNFTTIFDKEFSADNDEYTSGAFVYFDIDENGNFVNPKPIGNHAENEDLIKFLKGV